MWEELIDGINAGNYTNDELVDIFGSYKKSLIKDCKSCEYLKVKKITKLAKKSAKIVKKSRNKNKAEDAALKYARKLLKEYKDLPLSLVGIVDEDAAIQFDYR